MLPHFCRIHRRSSPLPPLYRYIWITLALVIINTMIAPAVRIYSGSWCIVVADLDATTFMLNRHFSAVWHRHGLGEPCSFYLCYVIYGFRSTLDHLNAFDHACATDTPRIQYIAQFDPAQKRTHTSPARAAHCASSALFNIISVLTCFISQVDWRLRYHSFTSTLG